VGPLTGAAGAWVTTVAAVVAWAWWRGVAAPEPAPKEAARRERRVLLVRPCIGGDAELLRALLSTATVLSSDRLTIRFAVASARDPAYPAACLAAEAARRARLAAAVSVTHARAPNRKADQLARVLAAHPEVDAVVVADSDVDLTGVDLDALVSPLGDDVGATWCPPVEVSPRTTADRASAGVLDASLHAFGVLARLDASGMVGKLFAVDARALAAAGGFASLTRFLGEDVELARRLRAAGWRVHVLPGVARSLASGRTARDVVARYARWLLVVRAQRAHLLLTYPLLLACTPLLFALCAAAAVREGLGVPAACAAGAVALRWGAAAMARAQAGRPGRPGILGDAVLADLLLLAAFARALAARRFVWRTHTLRVTRRGLLEAP